MSDVLVGDCREMLAFIPDDLVQCCVTSPPYFGLRSYLPDGHPDKGLEVGAETTPEAYIAEMVAVFRDVRRVLRHDGTLWLNLGDRYGDGKNQTRAKDRLLLPARVALALQADGWWLRDEIIWHKPRTTPGPVKDRTVAAHEMVYLLSKQPNYYFGWEALEEPSKYPGLVRKAGSAFRDLAASDPAAARKRPSADREITVRGTRRSRSVWSISPEPYKGAHFATMPLTLAGQCIKGGSRVGDFVLDPFFGAGTTGAAAKQLGRRAIGIELNPAYAEMAKLRVEAAQ